MTRYDRQVIFDKIGKLGQKRLNRATVSIVGLGGTGIAAALYLAGAGVNLRLVDKEKVDIVNLHRQVLYTEHDVARSKVEVAREKLTGLNSKIKIEVYPLEFDRTHDVVLKGSNFVIDGTDNMLARYKINEVCRELKIPFSYGGAIRDSGMVSTFVPEGPCLRCLFPELESIAMCEDVGVIGPAPGIVGLIEATEAIKSITGFGDLLVGKLLTINLSTMEFSTSTYQQKKGCPFCGKK